MHCWPRAQAALSWWSVVSPFGGVGSTAALIFVLLVRGQSGAGPLSVLHCCCSAASKQCIEQDDSAIHYCWRAPAGAGSAGVHGSSADLNGTQISQGAGLLKQRPHALHCGAGGGRQGGVGGHQAAPGGQAHEHQHHAQGQPRRCVQLGVGRAVCCALRGVVAGAWSLLCSRAHAAAARRQVHKPLASHCCC